MKIFIIATLTLLLLVVSGCQKNSPESISGTVLMVADNFVLLTDDNTPYKLDGGDFSDIVFQKITVIGSVSKEAKGSVIKVASYQPAS